MILLSEVVTPDVGLTADRWDVLLIVCCAVLFTCGYLVMVRS